MSRIQNIRAQRRNKSFSELLDGRLRVRKLQLENINAFQYLPSIDFNRQVTCFIGGNGSGKTTLLRAVALGLVGIGSFKVKPNLLAVKNAQGDVLYHYQGEIRIIFEYEKKSCGNVVQFLSMENGLGLAEGVNFPHLSEDVIHATILEAEETLKFLVVGFAQQSRSEPKISMRRRPNISDVEALILNQPDNRFDEFVNWFQEGLKKDIDEYKTFKKAISRIFSIVNNCIRKEEGDTSNDIDFVGVAKINLKTRQNPDGIPIDKISQGYRNLLGWVGFFAKRMYEYRQTLLEDGFLVADIDFALMPAVCLIDEIDTYLHPDWQYSILRGLVESFPNVQFIITSHSPFVLTSIPSDKITIYELETTENGSIEVHELTDNLYGADANRAVGEISTVRSPKFVHLFEALQAHIDNNELTEAKALLKTLINDERVNKDADLDIISAERLIKMKELLNKTKPMPA